MPLPDASCAPIMAADPTDRLNTGRRIVSRFLADGRIYGVTPQGDAYEHDVSKKLTRQFLAGLTSIKIRGSR